jgi:hypothetical protein
MCDKCNLILLTIDDIKYVFRDFNIPCFEVKIDYFNLYIYYRKPLFYQFAYKKRINRCKEYIKNNIPFGIELSFIPLNI